MPAGAVVTTSLSPTVRVVDLEPRVAERDAPRVGARDLRRLGARRRGSRPRGSRRASQRRRCRRCGVVTSVISGMSPSDGRTYSASSPSIERADLADDRAQLLQLGRLQDRVVLEPRERARRAVEADVGEHVGRQLLRQRELEVRRRVAARTSAAACRACRGPSCRSGCRRRSCAARRRSSRGSRPCRRTSPRRPERRAQLVHHRLAAHVRLDDRGRRVVVHRLRERLVVGEHRAVELDRALERVDARLVGAHDLPAVDLLVRAACRSDPAGCPSRPARLNASSSSGCISATTFCAVVREVEPDEVELGAERRRDVLLVVEVRVRSGGCPRAGRSRPCGRGSGSASSSAFCHCDECGSLSIATNAAAVAGTIDAPRMPVIDSPPQPAATQRGADRGGDEQEAAASRAYCRHPSRGLEAASGT